MKIKLLFGVLTFALLTGCAEEYENTTVEATIVEKDYDAPSRLKKKRKSAEYDVVVKYKDIEKEFDNKELYKKVKVGQKIKVNYKTGYDKDGKLVHESLELLNK